MSNGVRNVSVRDVRQLSIIGRYWNAVHRYLARGDARRLRRFRGIHIRTVSGEQVELLTDHAVLDQLGNAGVLSFETIYARTR